MKIYLKRYSKVISNKKIKIYSFKKNENFSKKREGCHVPYQRIKEFERKPLAQFKNQNIETKVFLAEAHNKN